MSKRGKKGAKEGGMKGSARAVDAIQDSHDPHRGGGIEVPGGLVGQQDQGTVYKGSGDGNPLLLSPRELIRVPGARATTVVVASSGNAGAAAAAYSARAGMECIVLTTVGIPPVMEKLLAGVGATFIGYRSTTDRNRMLKAAVKELGWYPAAFTDDRVGGNPYGNEGFKSIAYELARDHGDDLETVYRVRT